MHFFPKGLIPWVVGLAMAGCGGSNDGSPFVGPGSGGTGGSGAGNETARQVEMGAVVDGTFQRGTLASALPAGSSLPAGGSTQLTVSFRYTSDSTPVVGQVINVGFASLCPAGSVSFDYGASASGTLDVTYIYSGGCALSEDTVTAQASLPDGSTLSLVNTSATARVPLAPSEVGAIEFLSAEPSNIGLRGTGRTENSTVTFVVRDAAGGPRPNADVSFALSTSVGGITIQPSSARTGADGRAQTVVKAGSVATTVRVTATVQGPSGPISTQSSELTITTGIPDQNSLSLSFEALNPEAFDEDGKQVEVSLRLADRFNNPVPGGTAVYFTTEGGKIGGQCTTADPGDGSSNDAEAGICSVLWISQNPRPMDGRVTVLATTIGEESFQDLNGNGVFDDGDSFTDTGEAFRDDNENGERDLDEPFYDFNSNGTYDGPDDLYAGLLCRHSTRCAASTTTGIGASGVLVMSGSSATIEVSRSGSDSFDCLVGEIDGVPCGGSLTVDLRSSTDVILRVADYRQQPMPEGTSVSIDPQNGTVVGPRSYVQPQTNAKGPVEFRFILQPNDPPSSGPMFITVTTPGGVVTRGTVTVTD